MIKYTLRGGSGNGLSYYKKLLTCPNKAYLDKQEASELEVIGGSMGIGTLFHAFLDLYYRGDLPQDLSEVTFFKGEQEAMVDEVARAEAERLVRWYTDEYSAEHLGTVVATERTFTNLKASIVEGPAELPFSAGLDLIVDLDKDQTSALCALRGISLKPGRYVVDYKTEQALTAGLVDRYVHSEQMAAYQIVAQEIDGVPIAGALVDVLIKTKTPKSLLIPVEPPGVMERKMLKSFWLSVERKLQYPREVNLSACFFPKTCRHFLTSTCMRYEVE